MQKQLQTIFFSTIVLDNFNKPSWELSYFGFIINDFISSLAARPSSSVEFSRRKNRVVAHELARAATHMIPQVFDLVTSNVVDINDNDMR